MLRYGLIIGIYCIESHNRKDKSSYSTGRYDDGTHRRFFLWEILMAMGDRYDVDDANQDART